MMDSRSQKELEKIERQIGQLELVPGQDDETRREIQALARTASTRCAIRVSAQSSAWEKTELARHPQRPYSLDYIERIFTDWSEIHGDRSFGDDPAMVCGMARFHGEEVLVIGTQKGRDISRKSIATSACRIPRVIARPCA